jgi:heme exporter protein C
VNKGEECWTGNQSSLLALGVRWSNLPKRGSYQLMSIHRFAHPKKVEGIIRFVMPVAYGAAALSFAVGLYYALFNSPMDYQQGEAVRIMYVHVPASWFALFIYGFMGVSSASFLIFRIPLASYMAQAAAPIGAVYCFISLATGSLWGKPMWGTWWVWDARLTSMLILLLMYCGYMILSDSTDDKERSMKVVAYLAVVGLINLPIIKFSVEWWQTLHQPASVFRSQGSAIHPTMMVPLLWMAGGYLTLFVALLCHRLLVAMLALRVQAAQIKLTWQR